MMRVRGTGTWYADKQRPGVLYAVLVPVPCSLLNRVPGTCTRTRYLYAYRRARWFSVAHPVKSPRQLTFHAKPVGGSYAE